MSGTPAEPDRRRSTLSAVAPFHLSPVPESSGPRDIVSAPPSGLAETVSFPSGTITSIALVCPDGISILLFCKGIIHALKQIPHARLTVICDAGDYAAKIVALGVSCVSVPIYRWNSPWRDALYCFRLWRSLRHIRADVVLNFSTKSNIYGAIAAKLAGVKRRYMHVVGRGAGFQFRPGLTARLNRGLFVGLYRLSCRWSDKVWFTNRQDRRFFIDERLVSEGKTIITRNYLDVEEYAIDAVDANRRAIAIKDCGLQPGEALVIMVARMIWAKGIREFAEAAALLRQSHPGLRFVLIAPLETGSPDAVPETFIREAEQKANLRWLGFQTDVQRFYAISHLAVLPTFYKEGGYPRALLEPMAMGKPVITTDSEDCRGTVEEGKNGFLVPMRNPSALAVAIARIMDDPPLRTNLGNYSRVKAARDFDERKIVPAALRELGIPLPISPNTEFQA